MEGGGRVAVHTNRLNWSGQARAPALKDTPAATWIVSEPDVGRAKDPGKGERENPKL